MDLPLPLCDHVVYTKDRAGNLVKKGETVYENRILQHPPEFANLKKVFKQIQDLPLRKDDIWLLDYSKSGTHWMLSILQLLTKSELASVIESKLHGMLEASADLGELEKVPSPRILNTHMMPGLMPKQHFEKNKIIMMIRNPKSVAVSMFHHTKTLPFYDYEGNFHDYLPDFIEGSYPEFYGSWFDYVLGYWNALKGKPNVLFVFYEELKKDPVKVVKSVSDFLGLKHEQSLIESVVEKTTIDNLKKNQVEMSKDSAFGKFVNAMFRKGTSNDWKNHFTVAENEMFDALYEEKMKDYPDLKERIQFN